MNQEELNTMLDTIHVPEDAGEHADDLRRILSRIPPRWGRWISCASGWYPLIIELDKKLAEIFPDYELHQVKEKFGTLRYYIGFPQLDPQCCIDMEATRPCDGAINPDWLRGEKRTLKDQFELDAWFYTKFMPHLDSEEHHKQREALRPEQERRGELSGRMHKIINEYEDLSARICELCGAAAEMRVRHYWYRTLCAPCAEKDGYLPVPEEGRDETL
jgi:hypothetical protein